MRAQWQKSSGSSYLNHSRYDQKTAPTYERWHKNLADYNEDRLTQKTDVTTRLKYSIRGEHSTNADFKGLS